MLGGRYVELVLSGVAAADTAGVMVFVMVAPGAGGWCGPGPVGWEIELFAKGCVVQQAFQQMAGRAGSSV